MSISKQISERYKGYLFTLLSGLFKERLITIKKGDKIDPAIWEGRSDP